MTDQQLPQLPAEAIVVPIGLPTFYCNGFNISLTNTDVNIVVMVDNQPQMSVHLSFTSAKTLGFGLAQAITQLEKVTKRKIMKSTDIAEAIARQQQNNVGT